MRLRREVKLGLGLALIGLLALAPTLLAQAVTTGTLSGAVTLKEDGTPAPGVAVEAVHQPTGTRYSSVTRQDGGFKILNVRVGGPYTVTATLDGFRPAQLGEINVALGEDRQVELALEPETVAETIVVTAEIPLLDTTQAGSGSHITEEVVESLPTITRSLEDVARTNPYFSTTGGVEGGETETTISVAGRNNRYNTVLIDGAVNNDIFGLSPTGSPGGQAEAQPISLDAIKEVQLLVSPYDVRQGGFTGGGINAVTKNGTNEFHGGLYYSTRDEGWVGDGPFDREFAAFSQEEYGASLGGPIKKDKAFFFVNVDLRERETPSGFSPSTIGREAEIEEFASILRNTYGYDPIGSGEFIRNVDYDNYFARLDFNLGEAHQLTVRNNYVDSANDVYNGSGTLYLLNDRPYNIRPETNTTVAQLNSVFGSDLFNEARIGFTKVSTVRDGPTRFPTVQVDLSGGVSLEAGRERFSTANELDQDILEITDDLTFVRGDHTLTVGTHNELFSFRNLFIRDNFGFYNFRSMEDFENGWADQFEYSFSLTSDRQQAVEFDVQQWGLYAGDQWRVRDNVTLTYGLRADYLTLPDSPSYNPQVESLYGFRTDQVPDNTLFLSPRVGFNWDPTGEGKQQLRGGLGYFTGRTPYVWISNQYGNTGIEFQRLRATLNPPISATNNIPFVSDPDNQPTSVGSAQTNEINLTDPDFEMPQLWRANLAYDYELPWNILASGEVLYSQIEEDILYQNINIVQTGTTGLGGRPLYTSVSRSFSNVLLLGNSSEGKQTAATIQLRQRKDRLFWTAGYMWQDATEVMPGTSSQASSNWLNTSAVDPNDPGEATATFQTEHRLNATVSYSFDLGPVGNTVSLFYNRQSGRPYSTTFDSRADVNGDGIRGNDLLYVPASADEIILQGATWDEFNAYISQDDGLKNRRGRNAERNGSTGPWTSNIDFRWTVDLPISLVRVQVAADILNLYNLIDSDKGIFKYSRFGEVSPVSYGGIDVATGKPIYKVNFTNPDSRWTVDDVRSRWQAKLSLRVLF